MKGFNFNCCCGCVYFTDKFNRADSTTIGGDWDEVSGEWEIVDEELTTSDSNAEIRIEYDPNPYGVSLPAFRYSHPWVKVSFAANDGDIIRLNKYYYDFGPEPKYIIELEIGASGVVRAIYDNDSGGGEIIEWECDFPISGGEWHTLEMRLGSVGPVGSLFIDGDLVRSSYWIGGPIHSGKGLAIGLATVSISSSVEFDDFELANWRHYPDVPSSVSIACPVCPAIFWPPSCSPPETVELEISGLTDPFNYIGLNGTYTLTRVSDTSSDYEVDGLHIERVAGDGNPDFVHKIVFSTEFITDFRFVKCLTNDYGVSFVSFYLPSYAYSNDVADLHNFEDPSEIELKSYPSGAAIAVVTVP